MRRASLVFLTLAALSASTVSTVSIVSTAEAMPIPPKTLINPGGSGPINVKVRRIGELKIDSTTAPPPAIALTGQHKVLVVLVETLDSPWPKGYEPSRFEELLFSKATSSLREYYRENSYGTFDVTGTVMGPFRVPGKMSDYAYEMGASNAKVKKLIENAVGLAQRKTRLAEFDTHDSRGKPGADGMIDHLIVIYAEKSGDPQGFSPIWPHRGSTDFDAGDLRVGSYVVINHGAPLGVFVHEFGHDIGLPDLYDRDYTSHGDGAWCLMAAGGWGENGQKPSHLSAWGKIRMGWIQPTLIAKTTHGIALGSSSERPAALKIPFGAVDSREYFLVENRRRVGFDVSIPAEGLLIWHIDESRADNDDERRKMVDVVEGQNVQDLDHLEQGRFPDYLPDVFSAGGKNKDTLDDDTTPNARTNDGEPTKIRIHTSSPVGRVMNVDVDRPTIFNPGGVPYVLDKDGYRFGRFGFVPTGKSSEALVRFEATPGGYLIFGIEAFVAAPPNTRASAWIRAYEDDRGSPGKVLLQKETSFTTQADGYEWVRARLSDERGFKLAAHKRFWVGVSSENEKVALAFNPFSVSKEARFRRKGGKELVDRFNFKEGPEPVADYILRVNGFGYLDQSERPELLATVDDPEVKRLQAGDALADKKKFEEAATEYAGALAEMEKEPRRFESWLPVAVNALGVAEYELGRWDAAIDHFSTSLRRAQAARDAETEADIFENLCETAFKKGDAEASKKDCDRSRRINLGKKRHDRLVENYYWLGRAAQLGKAKGTEAEDSFRQARTEAEQAFAKDPAELSTWTTRIGRAEQGKPEDADKVAERVEKQEPKGPKEKAQYIDLLQFLDQDTTGPAKE